MPTPKPSRSSRLIPSQSQGVADPWTIIGYLIAGIGFYGGLGWLLDRWLGTRFLVLIGILGGLALGLYLIFAYLRRMEAIAQASPPAESEGSGPPAAPAPEAADTQQPADPSTSDQPDQQ